MYRLCIHSPNKHQHVVISLSGDGKYSTKLRKKGILVYSLSLGFNILSILKFFYLIKIIKSHNPDLIQTWMYHANLIGGIAAYFSRVKYILWNIRNTELELGKFKRRTIWISKVLSKLSYLLPTKIIYCAKSSLRFHNKIGYNKKKGCVIQNGFDTSYFDLKKKAEKRFRKKFNINLNIPILGSVGRFDPSKDYLNLFKALSILKKRKIPFFFILVGYGLDKSNKQLLKLLSKYKLINNVKLLGPKKNIPDIMSSINLFVLSSLTEAFPNVIGEAMSCRTPCISTNVGDSQIIIGNTGWIVPSKNPSKLSIALENSLKKVGTKSWLKKGVQARLRIKKNFNIELMIKSYNKIWVNLIK